MVRTIVQLTESQVLSLRRLARRRKVSVAAIVREAVDLRLAEDGGSRDGQVARARALAGSMRSGLGDLAENHDAYYAEAALDERRDG